MPRSHPSTRVQLRAVRRRERGERLVEVTGLEQRAVELCQRAPDGVREARETGAFGGRPGREPSDENASLGVTYETRARPLSPGEVLEERVERADRPGEQATMPLEQLPLDPLDVGALRDDQPRIAIERCDEAVEERPDFARVGRADDERQTHPGSVVSGPGASGAGALELMVTGECR